MRGLDFLRDVGDGVEGLSAELCDFCVRGDVGPYGLICGDNESAQLDGGVQGVFALYWRSVDFLGVSSTGLLLLESGVWHRSAAACS